MQRVIVAESTTVAVIAGWKERPVPSVARIAGLTTTMDAIVKNVVIPAMVSARSEAYVTQR